MTDALLPATPQPLEKENDGYFRKVGGLGRAGTCGLQTSFLPGCAEATGARGRGPPGQEGEGAHWAGAGRTEVGGEEGGRRCSWRPGQVASGAGRGVWEAHVAAQRRCGRRTWRGALVAPLTCPPRLRSLVPGERTGSWLRWPPWLLGALQECLVGAQVEIERPSQEARQVRPAVLRVSLYAKADLSCCPGDLAGAGCGRGRGRGRASRALGTSRQLWGSHCRLLPRRSQSGNSVPHKRPQPAE
ncbi:hypothetical protein P7K49_034063 [Saguinus oedipus]|uniref:Uncharacterized protein n=1 Tax=Saguinus oedipus TaxID=9490 RepID=A0ABQ9TTN4_SAGOE|nr:hypothetical protein P7K49_034063 [Saguinus oedipus]